MPNIRRKSLKGLFNLFVNIVADVFFYCGPEPTRPASPPRPFNLAVISLMILLCSVCALARVVLYGTHIVPFHSATVNGLSSMRTGAVTFRYSPPLEGGEAGARGEYSEQK